MTRTLKTFILLCLLLLGAIGGAGAQTTFTLPNANVSQDGLWTTGTGGTPSHPFIHDTNGTYSELNTVVTGTDCTMLVQAGTTTAISVTVDGTTTTPTLTATGSFVTLPVFAGLTNTAHVVKIKNVSTGNYFAADYGLQVAGTGAALSLPPYFGTKYYLNAAPWTTYGSLEGCPVTAAFNGIPGTTKLLGGQYVRFAANTSAVSVWDGTGNLAGQILALLQDGTVISTMTVSNLTAGYTVMATGLSGQHEYEVVQITDPGSGGATYISYVMLPGAGLSNVTHTPRPVDAFYGDSITNNYALTDARQGDEYISTRRVGHAYFPGGTNGSMASTYGRDNTSKITGATPAVARIFVRYGRNDAANSVTIGAVGTPGTFIGDYRTMITNLQSGSPSASIYCEGIFPQANFTTTVRSNYNAGIQTAIAGLTNVTYINTDNWINPIQYNATTAPTGQTIDGTHPNASGYASIAAREVAFFTPALFRHFPLGTGRIGSRSSQ